jgi:hypothetical protein
VLHMSAFDPKRDLPAAREGPMAHRESTQIRLATNSP